MTNKGQSLVIFVILLPIIFILITLVWELGNLSVVQSKYENETKEAIIYGLTHKDDPEINQKIKELLDSNIEGEKTITFIGETLKINVKNEYKTVYRMIFKDKFDINVTYVGHLENENVIIKKE
ncbi:MAG: hypothetical protein IKG27_01185 [Bacilli bacterium]|nr:hypothetical protein [Bacilli bacterium]